jgi:PucR family transcriptional regulator, purine catabolism regulatory protein
VTDLAELHAELLPAARSAGRTSLAGRQIAWVRVMKARVPAFDALEPGDLAIVPGSALEALAPSPEERSALVRALAGAPVSGAVLVEADGTGGPILDELAAGLDATEIPVLRLERREVGGLERSVIGFLVARGAELERQAGLLESELQRRALEGGGPEALVAAIATFLGRAAALESSAGRPLAVHAPPAAREGTASATRYLARPRQVAAHRFPLPTTGGGAGTGAGGTSGGALVLLGEAPVGELGRITAERIGTLLALELARDDAVRAAGDAARRVDTLPAGGPPWLVLVARQRGGADDDGPIRREAREAARHEVRLLAPARQMALRGDADSVELRAVLAVGRGARATSEPPSDDPERHPLAGRIAAILDRPVALSRPFGAPADRPAAEAEARATLDAALALPDPPRVARASRLPAYRLLGVVHNLPEGGRLAKALLEPILAGRPDVRREHVATLRAYLDRGGVNEAAAALGVHRNTVAYRLRRIEQVSGWRLSDPELRVALTLAVRIVQDDQL